MLRRSRGFLPALITVIFGLFVVGLCFSVVPPGLAAPNQNVNIQGNIPTILKLVTTSPNVSFTLAESDYDETTGDASIEQSAATVLKVIANVPWQVNVRAGASNFTYSPPGGASFTDPSKPVGDLTFKESTESSYSALTSSDQQLATGGPGASNNPTNTINVDYRLQSTLQDDPPGTYEISVTYTVTAQ